MLRQALLLDPFHGSVQEHYPAKEAPNHPVLSRKWNLPCKPQQVPQYCWLQVKEEAIDKILLIEQETNRNSQPIYQARAEAISKLPSFWKFVLLQHEVLRELVTLEDQEVLDYLEQVKASPLLECLACVCRT